jgi:cobalamin biosynthesis protein CbiG
VGYQRGVEWEALAGAIDQICVAHGLDTAMIAGMSTIDHKLADQGLIELCQHRGWKLVGFSAVELAGVDLATVRVDSNRVTSDRVTSDRAIFPVMGSEQTATIVGTSSVAVAAAILAATQWGQPRLRVDRQVKGSPGKFMTIAIAQVELQLPLNCEKLD